MKKRSVVTNSPEATIKLGKKISQDLKRGDIVLLYGELGSGKTVLIKGICQGLKVIGLVKSPSFVIINEYAGRLTVYHIDLYRLEGKDLSSLNLDDYFYNQGVTVVEWADRLTRPPDSGYMKIHLRHVDKKRRRITIYDFRD